MYALACSRPSRSKDTAAPVACSTCSVRAARWASPARPVPTDGSKARGIAAAPAQRNRSTRAPRMRNAQAAWRSRESTAYPTRGGAAERPSIMPLLGSDASTRAAVDNSLQPRNPKLYQFKIRAAKYSAAIRRERAMRNQHAAEAREPAAGCRAPPRGGGVRRRGEKPAYLPLRTSPGNAD